MIYLPGAPVPTRPEHEPDLVEAGEELRVALGEFLGAVGRRIRRR